MIRWFERWLEPEWKPAHGPRDARHPGWREYTNEVTVHRRGRSTRVRLRPLRNEDFTIWAQQRTADEAILQAVEPTLNATWEQAHSLRGWRGYWGAVRDAAERGEAVPFAIIADGQFVGQITLDEIRRMPCLDATVGYWIHRPYWGRGIATAALALCVDHAFARVGLHRLQATFMPDNPASGRVLEACGFQEEGLLRGNLHINGRWEDHFLMGLTRDRFANRAVDRLNLPNSGTGAPS